VRLAITPIGPAVAPVLGYHSSVLLGRTEYTFSNVGVVQADGPLSHSTLSAETRFVDCGRQVVNTQTFEAVIYPLFAPGTYDLLRKNCNGFADCAVCLLTGSRLDKRYMQMEALGRWADEYLSVVQRLSGGRYSPNPKSNGWDVDLVASELGVARQRLRCLPEELTLSSGCAPEEHRLGGPRRVIAV